MPIPGRTPLRRAIQVSTTVAGVLLGIVGLLAAPIWRRPGTLRALLAVMVAPGTDTPGAHHRHNLRPVDEEPGPVPQKPLSATTTAALRNAWQRRYWLLRDLPAGGPRSDVVNVRRRLLDELERRDRDGLRRWLQTAPNPGRYLTADHGPSHCEPPATDSDHY